MKMKTRLKVNTWGADETFEVTPQQLQLGLHRYPARCARKFQNLKEKISAELQWRFASLPVQLLEKAVNEAAGLAANTPFPSFFLPVLAEEKAILLSQWERKQRAIQEGSFLEAA
jgi:hypothetical protein